LGGLCQIFYYRSNFSAELTLYKYLGQLFTEYGDYKKAEMYLEKAEHAFKIAPGRAPSAEERLEKAYP